MANPQVEDGHIRIANEIWEQVLQRKFTRDELAVLWAVLWYSYGYGLKDAEIPKLKDFMNFGVDPRRISTVIDRLVKANVIDDLGSGMYEFRKDYDYWAKEFNQSSLPGGDPGIRIKELGLNALKRKRNQPKETTGNRNNKDCRKPEVLPTSGSGNFQHPEVGEHVLHVQPITSTEKLPKSGSQEEGPDLLNIISSKIPYTIGSLQITELTDLESRLGPDSAVAEFEKCIAWYESNRNQVPRVSQIINWLERALVQRGAGPVEAPPEPAGMMKFDVDDPSTWPQTKT